MTAGASRAAVELPVMVEWSDTDASGHFHNAAVLRRVERAEALPYRELGMDGAFGRVPRVRQEVDLLIPLYFGDQATVRLQVTHVGLSSPAFAFDVSDTSGRTVSRRSQTVVHVAVAGGAADPCPAPWRAALTCAGLTREHACE